MERILVFFLTLFCRQNVRAVIIVGRQLNRKRLAAPRLYLKFYRLFLSFHRNAKMRDSYENIARFRLPVNKQTVRASMRKVSFTLFAKIIGINL
jgi:hypothetical protein